MATILCGITNCDTVRKARTWLEEHGVDYDFHDFRRQGLDINLLQSMESALGWEAMLNRRGTTWRKLPEEVRNAIERESAMRVMQDQPAIVKRPVLIRDQHFYIGFSDERYREIFEDHD